MQQRNNNAITLWFAWYFMEMPTFLFSVWKNYILFGFDYFSVPLLLSTLFLPWRKYSWNYPKSFSALELLNTLVSNFFSRIIGAICRLVLIIAGVAFQIFILVAGGCIIMAWILLPLIWLSLLLVLFR